MKQHQIDIEVRYHETDAQGHVHHANYLNYFELGRVEFLKALGHDYADLERQGYRLVIVEIGCRYRRSCRFGDTVRLTTRVERVAGTRIWHSYELHGQENLLVEGNTTVACIDADGRPARLPQWLRGD